ncbi:unnamed protein product [Prorocentrum cordatum]|uniref:Uncharacterized protein n=1 Tax=Prorocentrum cordatum TaxID=2364126 RepID=A0ABN9QCE2_9DINO|nr:unnamed protein product [Polarella glacialis]
MKRNVLAFHQLPYVVLVMFNSLVVPCWIEAMQRARSPFRRSFVDLKGISTNLQLLLFSKLVMPFVSLVLADLVVFQTRGPTEVPVDLHDVEGIIEEPAYNVVGEVGSFYSKGGVGLELLPAARGCRRVVFGRASMGM